MGNFTMYPYHFPTQKYTFRAGALGKVYIACTPHVREKVHVSSRMNYELLKRWCISGGFPIYRMQNKKNNLQNRSTMDFK